MSKRISVKLSELKANPFKRFIQGGAIDEDVVLQIMESAERTSLWEQWVAREVASGYQLAFGHNRLEAAKRILGGDAKVSVQVEDYDDAQMYIAMSDENAGEVEKPANQVDVIRKAKQLLEANPGWCKANSVSSRDTIRGNPNFVHEHGSVNCILAFLGEHNWSRAKVGKLLKLAEEADDALLAATASRDAAHQPRQGKVSPDGALALSSLPKLVQRAAVETIEKAEIAIPADAVKDAVEEVEQLPPSRQEAGIKRALKRKAESQRLAEIERKRKREDRGKPKAKKEIPKVGALMALWAAQIKVITGEIAALKPHKQLINKDANFAHLDKRITELADLISELRVEKPKPEPVRTAQQDLKQLN